MSKALDRALEFLNRVVGELDGSVDDDPFLDDDEGDFPC